MSKYLCIFFGLFCMDASACRVIVYIWNPLPIIGGILSFGHASIQVHSDYLSFHKGHITTMTEDNVQGAQNWFVLDESQLNLQKMIEKINEIKLRGAQLYSLFNINCTYTVAQVLRAGGMDLGDIYNYFPSSPTPYRLRDHLLQDFAEPSKYIRQAIAKGRTEKKFLKILLKEQTKFELSKETTYCSVVRK